MSIQDFYLYSRLSVSISQAAVIQPQPRKNLVKAYCSADSASCLRLRTMAATRSHDPLVWIDCEVRILKSLQDIVRC